MRRKLFAVLWLAILCSLTLVVTVNSGRAQRNEFESPNSSAPALIQPLTQPENGDLDRSTVCALEPDKNPKPYSASTYRALVEQNRGAWTLDRFRRSQAIDFVPDGSQKTSISDWLGNGYRPQEQIVTIDPTNYGDRFLHDINGNPVNQEPIVVLHETVGSAGSALNFFRTPHFRDADQASYHVLIKLDGSVLYLVPPDKRAYGAGNSNFIGDKGQEAVKTHPRFPPSVNNFAYHISLETPRDGNNNAYRHSGYTTAQYQSLAWIVAKTGIPDHRITTHRAVDRSGQRMDPRSFNFPRFFQLLQTFTKTNEIVPRCTVPS
jgi:hypothetical protein